MPDGLAKTLELLVTTRNESAGDVLWHALEQGNLAVQKLALGSLLRRRSPAALRKVVANWHTFSAKLKDVTLEHRGRLTKAIRDAIFSRAERRSANGGDAAGVWREYEIVPALLTVVRSSEPAQAAQASRTMIELVQSLHVELEQTRDSRARRASQLAHAHVASALEEAARQFHKHRRKDILAAFLIIAGRENATLKRILREPTDTAHAAVVELLAQSPRPPIARLTTSFLEDTRAPQAALAVLSQRRDDLFVQHFLRTVGDDPSPNVRGNLQRLTKLRWLQSGLSQLMFLDERAQVALAQTVGCSGLPDAEILRVLRDVLRHGKLRARRAAARLLQNFEGLEANRLIMQTLRDGDIEVQAAALAELRARGLPGATATLLAALDSPHPLLQQTARQCLSEFDMPRFLQAYDGMDEEERRTTGRLVRKVDTNSAALLREEMQSPSRSRRLKAIDVAQALEMTGELEEPLLALLNDEDHLVRVAAAEALSHCPTDQTRIALRSATLDESPNVRSAAQRALDEMVVATPGQSGASNVDQAPATAALRV